MLLLPARANGNRYLFERLIRTVMFRHVSLLALDDTTTLAQLDERIAGDYPDWYAETEAYWAEYDDMRTDQMPAAPASSPLRGPQMGLVGLCDKQSATPRGLLLGY